MTALLVVTLMRKTMSSVTKFGVGICKRAHTLLDESMWGSCAAALAVFVVISANVRTLVLLV